MRRHDFKELQDSLPPGIEMEPKLIIWIIAIGATIIFLLSFLIGLYPISPEVAVKIMGAQFFDISPTWNATMETVMLQVRLPRICAAFLVGGALAVSGAAYQGLFKNPLVSPAILGVSSGAGFGAALGMILYLPLWGIQACAFSMGLVAVSFTFLCYRTIGDKSMVILVLAGVIVSSLFQALISIVKYLADPMDTLPAITFWLMGGLAKITQQDVIAASIPILLSFAAMYAVRWQINVLSVGDEEAASLGINITKLRLLLVLCATLMTAAAVSISGIVGWVGIVIPHMARILIGPNFQLLLPASFLLGGGYLMVVDDIGRSVNAMELPVGILTALFGAPFFIYLLSKSKKGWGQC